MTSLHSTISRLRELDSKLRKRGVFAMNLEPFQEAMCTINALEEMLSVAREALKWFSLEVAYGTTEPTLQVIYAKRALAATDLTAKKEE